MQLQEPFYVDLTNTNFKGGGFKLYLDDKDSLDLNKDKIYDKDENDFIHFLLHNHPDWNCIDIGANIGYFTILMAMNCKFVYAFEPDNNNYVLLHKNLNLNRIKNAVCFCRAVVEHDEGEVKLHECTFNRGMHRIYPSKWCEGKVTNVIGIRLDDFNKADDKFIDPIHFIKIDIEGAELGALKGMKNLLNEFKPELLIEFHPPTIQEYGHDPKDTYDFLLDMGYHVNLLATSFIPTSITQYNISYNALWEGTVNSPGRNIWASKEDKSY